MPFSRLLTAFKDTAGNNYNGRLIAILTDKITSGTDTVARLRYSFPVVNGVALRTDTSASTDYATLPVTTTSIPTNTPIAMWLRNAVGHMSYLGLYVIPAESGGNPVSFSALFSVDGGTGVGSGGAAVAGVSSMGGLTGAVLVTGSGVALNTTTNTMTFTGGSASTAWKGAWNVATAYAIGDQVAYGGSSYISKTAHTGVTPAQGATWDVMAQGGASGSGGVETVATLATLRSTTGMATGSRKLVQEYGFYRWVAADASIDNGYSRIRDTGNTGCWLLEVVGVQSAARTRLFNAVEYGVVADATTDDTAAIQRAINAASASGGGIVQLPEGTMRILGGLTVTADNVEIRGVSRTGSILDAVASTNTNIITVGHADAFNAVAKTITVNAGTAVKTGKVTVRKGLAASNDHFKSDANISVTGVTSVVQGATTYAPTTDYTVGGLTVATVLMGVNNFINWAPAGAAPADGTLYTVTYTYIEAGAKDVTVDGTAGLAVGDWVMITSIREAWNFQRNTYFKGEAAQIKAINTTTNVLTMKHDLRDSYLATHGKVTRLHPIKDFRLRDLCIQRSPTFATGVGVAVTWGDGPRIENVKTQSCCERGIGIYGAINAVVRNCQLIDSWIAGGGTNYGVGLHSTHGATVDSCFIDGGRHSISTGNINGQPPARDIFVRNSYLANTSEPDATTQSVDCHGSVDNMLVEGNVIQNGVITSGRSIVVRNNTIYCNQTQLGMFGGQDNLYGEIHMFVCEGNRIFQTKRAGVGNGSAITFYSAHFGCAQTRFLKIANNYIRTEAADQATAIDVYGNGGTYGYIVGVVQIEGNVVDQETGLALNAIRVDFKDAAECELVSVGKNAVNRSIRVIASQAALVQVCDNVIDGTKLAANNCPGIVVGPCREDHTGQVAYEGNLITNMKDTGVRFVGPGANEVTIVANTFDGIGRTAGTIEQTSCMSVNTTTQVTAIDVTENVSRNSALGPFLHLSSASLAFEGFVRHNLIKSYGGTALNFSASAAPVVRIGNIDTQAANALNTVTQSKDDFENLAAGKGYMLKAANGTRYRITVSNTGALVVTAAP